MSKKFYLTRQELANIEAKAYERGKADGKTAAIETASIKAHNVILWAAANVIYNNWGKLIKKASRIQNFYELYTHYLHTADKPTPQMIGVEKQLEILYNMEFKRKK